MRKASSTSRVKIPLTTKVRLSQQIDKNQFLPCTLLNAIKGCKNYINGSCSEEAYSFAGVTKISQPKNNQADVTLFTRTPFSSIKPMLENSHPGSIHLSAFSVSTTRLLSASGARGKENACTSTCTHVSTYTKTRPLLLADNFTPYFTERIRAIRGNLSSSYTSNQPA